MPINIYGQHQDWEVYSFFCPSDSAISQAFSSFFLRQSFKRYASLPLRQQLLILRVLKNPSRVQKDSAALLMHYVSRTILSTLSFTLPTNSSNSLRPTLCLRYSLRTTSIAIQALRGLLVSMEPMMHAMGVGPRQAITVRSGHVLRKQQQVKTEQGSASSARRISVIHLSQLSEENVLSVIYCGRTAYIHNIIINSIFQHIITCRSLTRPKDKTIQCTRNLPNDLPMLFRRCSAGQLTFIMKVQNIEDVRTQLFNEQVKLTTKQRIKKEHFLLKIPLFDLIYQKKGDQNFQIILSHIQLIKVDFGQIIFEKEDLRTFNFILKGSIMLFTRTKQDDKRGPPKLYKRLEAGQHFGEKMQYGKEEVESFRSATPGYLLQLPMSVFYNTFAGHFKYEELRDKINFLKSIWIFSQVKRNLLERILLSSQCRKYSRNTLVCREGDLPQQLFVILDGELTLNMTKEGKSRAFCVLGKSEVCGIEEIIEDRPFEYTVICTSDSAYILKVDKEAIIGIVERDIKPDILKKRKQVAIELKNKNLDSSKLAIYSQKQIELTGRSQQIPTLSHRRRYKSEGGQPSSGPRQPINRIKVLNELFNRQVQLKQSELRRYKLRQIEQSQKNLYSTRIATYTNNSCTYDKEIIIKYLGRKQRKYQDILRREREFIERRIVAVMPELRVERSSAVKNQKRKLKYSRKQLYSTLQIDDSNK